MNPYDADDMHAGESINQPPPPEHEPAGSEDCADHEGCAQYANEVR